MVHKTILQHYVEEILGDGLHCKLEGVYNSYASEERKGNEVNSKNMDQLRGLGTARSERVCAQPPAAGRCMAAESVRVEHPAGDGRRREKLGPRLRKTEDCVFPDPSRMCRMHMEGVDILIGKRRKDPKRAGKRDTILMQMISSICKCFMIRTSRAETKPRRHEIKPVITPRDTEDNRRRSTLRRKRTEVVKVNLFCDAGIRREATAKGDRSRAAEEESERIQHQRMRQKLNDPHPHVRSSKLSKDGEDSHSVLVKHLKNLCNILRHQQIPVPKASSNSRPTDRPSEKKKSSSVRSKFSTSSGMGHCQTKYQDSPQNSNCSSKDEEKVKPVTRTSEKQYLIATEMKRNFISASGSHGARTDREITATSTSSKEPPPAPSVLQRSKSLKDRFEPERKAEIESQMKQRDEILDVFQEIEGESPHHRKLRYEGFKHLESCKRAARKIEAIHQQEEARQREQDEKSKVAYELDPHIQRWSYGKEGNLRALLSTVHNVLWPDCKWKMVPPSELVTPTSVKKIYRRASFSLHPDKVQQRGGTLEQKYVAEKVFGVLREAWNKFYNEEFV